MSNALSASASQGSDTITASYSGDANYLPTTYATLEDWGVPVGWNAATTVARVNPGQTATYQLTLSSSTFTGTATLICVAGKEYSNPMPTVPGAACSISRRDRMWRRRRRRRNHAARQPRAARRQRSLQRLG